jgi:hypothetical protein
MNYNFCLRSNLITSTEVKLSLWSKQQLNKASTRVLGHLGHFLGICSTWTLHDFCCRIHLESFGKSCKVWLMICNFIHLMVQFQHLGSHWNKDMTYHFMWLFDSKLHETFHRWRVMCDIGKKWHQHSLALPSITIKHTHIETQNNKVCCICFKEMFQAHSIYTCFTCCTSMFHMFH